MKKIRVSLGKRSYDILIGYGLIDGCGRILKRMRMGSDAIVITNPSLARLRKRLEGSLKRNGFTVRCEVAPDSEQAKSERTSAAIINRIAAYDRLRKCFIIALGGGVIGDLAGFIASVYKRGIPYVQIPTTLLAQVDSAIGGKVAIDLPVAKNLVGSFYQPKAVISDISVLSTLSSRQVRSGLSEIIKYGVIKDRALFEYLERNYSKIIDLDRRAVEFVIYRSSAIKARLVALDELDNKGVRVILNYGHTIGHAIEAAGAYSGRFNHGEAVAIGMIGAARISARLGLLNEADRARIERLVEASGLPTRIGGLRFASVYNAHLHDKKFIRKKNRFILPVAIGRIKVVEGVPDAAVKSVLKGLFA